MSATAVQPGVTAGAERARPPAAFPEPSYGIDLEALAAQWQRSLDAAERALHGRDGSMPPEYARYRRHGLTQERRETAGALARLARVSGVRPAPWLPPTAVTPGMLGLPAHVHACLFDLDGVLTDSGELHAWAWGAVFDDFLLTLADKLGWGFIPFDREAEYREFIDGRPRLEGVEAFLASRGIRIPEGRPDDPPDANTMRGLAARKGAMLTRALGHDGVNALTGARRYVKSAWYAGLRRGVVSASTSTLPMLQLAGLAGLVEERVDADVIRTAGLRSRPAPDLLLEACRRLAVEPAHAATLTHSPAGIAAGHTAGLVVIGIGEAERGELLEGFGAERVVPSLEALLDPRLREKPA
jgi:beta-phosphoglucomutase-like phosphatase (HAD superfamily)